MSVVLFLVVIINILRVKLICATICRRLGCLDGARIFVVIFLVVIIIIIIITLFVNLFVNLSCSTFSSRHLFCPGGARVDVLLLVLFLLVLILVNLIFSSTAGRTAAPRTVRRRRRRHCSHGQLSRNFVAS